MSNRNSSGRTIIGANLMPKFAHVYLRSVFLRRALNERDKALQMMEEARRRRDMLKAQLDLFERELDDNTDPMEVEITEDIMDMSLDVIESTGVSLECRPESELTLQSLCRLADWVGLDTRKAIKALAGDYEVEIRRLLQEGRPRVAKWNCMQAWGVAVWLVLKSPVSWVVNRALSAFRGSGA